MREASQHSIPLPPAGALEKVGESSETIFNWDYEVHKDQLMNLYEKSKRLQWNAATDIDWNQPLEGDGGLIADDLVDIHGSPFWDRLSSAQRVEINLLVTRWRLRHAG